LCAVVLSGVLWCVCCGVLWGAVVCRGARQVYGSCKTP
jgi:hypothetical protein